MVTAALQQRPAWNYTFSSYWYKLRQTGLTGRQGGCRLTAARALDAPRRIEAVVCSKRTGMPTCQGM